MTDSSPSFVCPHCGRSHDDFPTDYGYSLPDDVWAVPEEERASKAKWTSDLCQFGERYFIRCLLPLQFTDRDGYFSWGLWAEVEWPVFERYLQIYEQDATSEPAASAKLANQPPGYERVLGCPVSITFGTSTERPRIEFFPGHSDGLASEQVRGITSARYHQILENIGAI